MNLDIFKKELIGKTANCFSWEEGESDENSIRIFSDIQVRCCDDNVRMNVECNSEGVLLVTYVFDAINYSSEALKLVNYFNENVCFLKAYVAKSRRANFLKIEFANPKCTSVENACDQVMASLDILQSSSVLKYLQPLAVITEG